MAPRLFYALLSCLAALAGHTLAEDGHQDATDALNVARRGSAPRNQNVTFGRRHPFDSLLQNGDVYQAREGIQMAVTYSANATIHCVEVVDLMQTGKNAAVTLKGDLGRNAVTLNFKNQKGEETKYQVAIWGQKYTENEI